eukprot:CAMPEP_0113474770 /NCGR_PEP_ID=MMETSP0014_2-20120614/18766_1 /TAXON_ID=2857 /ORGANISM="Nitzschia sp." /LENGTH=197 /DNA_ID=CAMNT_0000367649 /DNA_START=351 /DNA_END=944 /DNA_ORIENTATION=+ /assembly_acc=CAM_ASM_000159
MKLAILASLVASAAAFAPAQQKASSTALNAFEDALGAQPPLGFFDPLGLVADGDEEKFERLRYVEIKHGRICMLGVLGYLVEYLNIRDEGDTQLFVDHQCQETHLGGTAVVELDGTLGELGGFVEGVPAEVDESVTGESEFPGDFRNGFIDFGWDSFDESTKLSKRAIELNNGRAAQMGLLALMVHEKLGVSLIPDV